MGCKVSLVFLLCVNDGSVAAFLMVLLICTTILLIEIQVEVCKGSVDKSLV